MWKPHFRFVSLLEPKNAATIGVAGAMIMSATFANASFFQQADTSVTSFVTTGSTVNTGFTPLQSSQLYDNNGNYIGNTSQPYASFGTTQPQQQFTNSYFASPNNNSSSGIFSTYNNGQPINSSSVNVLAIGDDIVHGIGATNSGDLLNLLGQAEGVTIINAGSSNLTTAQVLQGIDAALSTYHPNVVILMLGANDAAQGIAMQTEFSNLQQIVQHIEATGAKVIIVGDYRGTVNATYESSYSQLASMTGAYYVPNALDGIIGNSAMMSDGIHLNNQGYFLLASRIDPAFRIALQAAVNGNGYNNNYYNNNYGNNQNSTLQVNCTATPSSTSVGQSLTWQAVASGGTENYTYSWSGTDGLAGTSRQLMGSYATPGTKSATVSVISGNQQTSATCSTTITQVAQVGACFYPNGQPMYPTSGNNYIYPSSNSNGSIFSGSYLNNQMYPASNFQSYNGTTAAGSYPYGYGNQVTYLSNTRNNIHSNIHTNIHY